MPENAPIFDSADPRLLDVQTKAAGPGGALPLSDEMLRNWSSGDLFGLTQNAGMGWPPVEMLGPQFLLLSTAGGVRRDDGSPVALGFLLTWRLDGSLTFGTRSAGLDLLIAASGLVTAFPLLAFGQAARRLPLSSLGFMQFFSPTIQRRPSLLFSLTREEIIIDEWLPRYSGTM